MATTQNLSRLPLTTSSPEQRAQTARSILVQKIGPTDALKRAKDLVGEYPNLKPDNPTRFIESVGQVLAEYPAGLVEECIHPMHGIARKVEFLSIKSLAEWLDQRMEFYRAIATHKPIVSIARVEPEFSDEHRQGMLKRLQDLMRDVVAATKREDAKFVRAVGIFEHPDDEWNRGRRHREDAPQAAEDGDAPCKP